MELFQSRGGQHIEFIGGALDNRLFLPSLALIMHRVSPCVLLPFTLELLDNAKLATNKTAVLDDEELGRSLFASLYL